jgi:aromatic-L-amino-acid/L-tryptophan decarboxylase
MELLADVTLNVVCFRYRPADLPETSLNDLNKELLLRLQKSGIAVVSSTVLDKKFALRAAISNHRSRREDIDILVQDLRKIGETVAEEMRRSTSPLENNRAKA